MIIQEFEDLDLLSRLGNSELPRLPPPAPRTRDVLHLSDIYKKLMQRLQPARFNNNRPMDMVRVEMGLLVESVIERALAEKFGVCRPGELVSPEGVWMSPDGVNPVLDAGEEYKTTYMSCSKGISETILLESGPTDRFSEKFIHWQFQILGYAKWLFVRTFILRVLFVAGNHSWPISPLFKNYKIEFSDQEMDENWALLMLVAREEGLLK